MDASSLPAIVTADPTLAAGVVVRMAAAVAAGGLPVFPRLDFRLRAAATLALVAAAAPAAVPAGGEIAVVPLVVGEAIVGFGLGLAAALVFASASWAGGILGTVAGLNWADEANPDSVSGEGGAARLAAWMATAGFLAAGGHLVIIAGLVDSVRRMPVGLIAAGDGHHGLAELMATMPSTTLALALALAAPALVAVVSFHVSAAICVRAVRLAPGPGLVQAAASLVLLAAVLAGAGAWTQGFAAAVQSPLERCFLDSSR